MPVAISPSSNRSPPSALETAPSAYPLRKRSTRPSQPLVEHLSDPDRNSASDSDSAEVVIRLSKTTGGESTQTAGGAGAAPTTATERRTSLSKASNSPTGQKKQSSPRLTRDRRGSTSSTHSAYTNAGSDSSLTSLSELDDSPPKKAPAPQKSPAKKKTGVAAARKRKATERLGKFDLHPESALDDLDGYPDEGADEGASFNPKHPRAGAPITGALEKGKKGGGKKGSKGTKGKASAKGRKSNGAAVRDVEHFEGTASSKSAKSRGNELDVVRKAKERAAAAAVADANGLLPGSASGCLIEPVLPTPPLADRYQSDFRPPPMPLVQQLYDKRHEVLRDALLEATRDSSLQTRCENQVESALAHLEQGRQQSSLCLMMNRYSSFCALPQVNLPVFPITNAKLALFLSRVPDTPLSSLMLTAFPQPAANLYPLPMANLGDPNLSLDEGPRVTQELLRSWVDALAYAQMATKEVWEEILDPVGWAKKRAEGSDPTASQPALDDEGSVHPALRSAKTDQAILEILRAVESVESIRAYAEKQLAHASQAGHGKGKGKTRDVSEAGLESLHETGVDKKRTKWTKGGKTVQGPSTGSRTESASSNSSPEAAFAGIGPSPIHGMPALSYDALTTTPRDLDLSSTNSSTTGAAVAGPSSMWSVSQQAYTVPAPSNLPSIAAQAETYRSIQPYQPLGGVAAPPAYDLSRVSPAPSALDPFPSAFAAADSGEMRRSSTMGVTAGVDSFSLADTALPFGLPGLGVGSSLAGDVALSTNGTVDVRSSSLAPSQQLSPDLQRSPKPSLAQRQSLSGQSLHGIPSQSATSSLTFSSSYKPSVGLKKGPGWPASLPSSNAAVGRLRRESAPAGLGASASSPSNTRSLPSTAENAFVSTLPLVGSAHQASPRQEQSAFSVAVEQPHDAGAASGSGAQANALDLLATLSGETKQQTGTASQPSLQGFGDLTVRADAVRREGSLQTGHGMQSRAGSTSSQNPSPASLVHSPETSKEPRSHQQLAPTMDYEMLPPPHTSQSTVAYESPRQHQGHLPAPISFSPQLPESTAREQLRLRTRQVSAPAYHAPPAEYGSYDLPFRSPGVAYSARPNRPPSMQHSYPAPSYALHPTQNPTYEQTFPMDAYGPELSSSPYLPTPPPMMPRRFPATSSDPSVLPHVAGQPYGYPPVYASPPPGFPYASASTGGAGGSGASHRREASYPLPPGSAQAQYPGAGRTAYPTPGAPSTGQISGPGLSTAMGPGRATRPYHLDQSQSFGAQQASVGLGVDM